MATTYSTLATNLDLQGVTTLVIAQCIYNLLLLCMSFSHSDAVQNGFIEFGKPLLLISNSILQVYVYRMLLFLETFLLFSNCAYIICTNSHMLKYNLHPSGSDKNCPWPYGRRENPCSGCVCTTTAFTGPRCQGTIL